MKTRIIPFLAAYMAALASDPFVSKRTVTTPNSPVHPTYNLPLWRVGEHKIYAKNAKDALKYAKKRGLWDGTSYPITIV